MNQSALFQKLIDYTKKTEDLSAAQKIEICSYFEYFKTQFLCDLDRRDKPDDIKKCWLELERLIQGSTVFDSLRKDKTFWIKIEDAIGVSSKIDLTAIPKAQKRKLTPEEFFLSLSHKVKSTLPDNQNKNLLLYGLWCLELEAKLAKPYRTQKRVEEVYRYIHPILKKYDLLKSFENDSETKNTIRYFIKGSIFSEPRTLKQT